jgi:hypothetical protein
VKRLFDKSELPELGNLMLAWFREDEKRFWLKEFCIYCGFSSANLTHFAEQCEHFAKCLEMCKDIQEFRLVKIGLFMNKPLMAIFALKNVANWRDSSDMREGSNDFDNNVSFG